MSQCSLQPNPHWNDSPPSSPPPSPPLNRSVIIHCTDPDDTLHIIPLAKKKLRENDLHSISLTLKNLNLNLREVSSELIDFIKIHSNQTKLHSLPTSEASSLLQNFPLTLSLLQKTKNASPPSDFPSLINILQKQANISLKLQQASNNLLLSQQFLSTHNIDFQSIQSIVLKEINSLLQSSENQDQLSLSDLLESLKTSPLNPLLQHLFPSFFSNSPPSSQEDFQNFILPFIVNSIHQLSHLNSPFSY